MRGVAGIYNILYNHYLTAFKVGAQVDDFSSFDQCGSIIRSWFFLQADECCLDAIEDPKTAPAPPFAAIAAAPG